MTATEAHKLAAVSRQGPVIESQLNFVLQRIEEASKKGRFELNNPFNGWNVSAWPSEGEKKAVWQALRALGYEVDHMPELAGWPGSSPYDRIRW